MVKQDYYETLGLSKGVSKDEIKKAYRRLAKKYHPDVSTEENALKKFKDVQKAYEILSDDQKRAQYDQVGHGGANQGFDGGFGFTDIFSSFFSRGGDKRRDPNAPLQGADLQYQVTLDFEEAIFGKEQNVEIPVENLCDTCKGNGAKPGTSKETCTHCLGAGQVSVEQNTPFGRIVNRQACEYCSGTGQIIKEKCTTCHGSGKVRKHKKINVKIPAGIDNGQQIRVSGKGEAGMNGGPAGDLYVVVHVRNHEFFKREGNHIICEMPLTFVQMALGAEVEVPTVHGKVKLKIPAGTQTGTEFRLKGKGAPNVRGYGRGDQYVVVRVVVPTKLTSHQKDLLREFAEQEEPEDGFFGKFMRVLKGE
ncbi:molecular chaperone DnaJ [Bacillus thuringiensis]|uniref:Chaperone protein DnaJ n=1 Tax=Bacillus thuringiensis TaxID=1428 RepID=A0A9X6TKF3_BACTU|nr:molecular chaperone DnaJ [Bacillus thuringiensis]PEA87577.1 molecular chaperone DnaJ [Bacillus thuringiensis]